MNQDNPTQILMQGAKVWNAWRENNYPTSGFTDPFWYDCPGSDGVQVKGNNQLDFSDMNLSGILIHSAFAEGLNLQRATFDGTTFEEGDFSRADFRGATFLNTKFNKTILTGANFDGATFINCNLNRVNLVGASFQVKEITETVVYGISAWDLVTSEESKQSKLVIEKTYDLYSDFIKQGELPLMVEDIELAQFIYYLSNHKKLRDTLNILNDKGVLLLGRFKDGGLERLYSIRDWLHRKGYMAMIFDFDRPDNLSKIETVVTMAGLSKFIIADLSGSSVGHELASIVPQLKKPLIAFGNIYALVPDLDDHTGVITIKDTKDENLLKNLEKSLPEIEMLHETRIRKLIERDERMRM